MKKGKRKLPVFWLIYAAAALLVIVGVRAADIYFEGVLTEYEASRPQHIAAGVYNEYFRNFDAAKYLEKCDGLETGAETKERIAKYLGEKVNGTELTYYSVSADAADTYKYSVRAGDAKIASFTLKKSEEKQGRFETYVPDSFEAYYAANYSAEVLVPDNCTLTVNLAPASDEYITERGVAGAAAEHMPDGVSDITCRRYVFDALVAEPELSAVNSEGVTCEIAGSNGKYEVLQAESASLRERYGEYVLGAMKKYAVYIQYNPRVERVTFADISRYFDSASELYRTVRTIDNQYSGEYESYEFENERAYGFVQHAENIFSCRVALTQVLHSADADDYRDMIDYTLYMRIVGDSAFIYDMTKN